MKKRLFFLPMVAIIMAACSSNETIEVNENKGDLISFRPIVKGVTRAADISSDNLTSFVVNAKQSGGAISYFDNGVFNKSGSVFVSESKYYWPASGSLDFYAYSPSGNAQVNYSGYKTFTVTPSTTIADQVDFVFAATKEKDKASCGASGVTLNFRHTGAKIACNVKNSSTTLKFDVYGWKVGYICPAATFIFTDANTDGNNDGSGTTLTLPQWGSRTAASIGTEYESTFSVNQIGQSGATSLDGQMILIPQAITAASGYASASAGANLNGTYIAVKLKIRNNDSTGTIIADDGAGNAFWAIWPIGGYDWEPGKKYTYTIDLAGGGYYETNQEGTDGNLDAILEGAEIKFATVTVDGWTDQAYNVPTPTNLTELKNFSNVGIDCSNCLGYYVKTDGSISNVKGDDDLGFIAQISTTPVDESFSGSRILVLSQNKLLNQYNIAMGFGWASMGPGWDLRYEDTNIPNIKDVNRLNGFANTQAIYNLRTDAVTVPARAWTYQSKNGSAVIEGSSGWFLPSLGQWKAIYSSLGNEKIQEKLDEIECVGSYIWTSTESSNRNAWAWSYNRNEEHLYDIEKTQSCLGFPCFVY